MVETEVESKAGYCLLNNNLSENGMKDDAMSFMEKFEMLKDPNISHIQNFFDNKTIFITGASGFIGKLIMEKLLRTCNVKKIYILLRSKKDKMASTRFAELFDNPIFVHLKREQADYASKVCSIIGDCKLPFLGILPEDQEIIINEVDIIFHAAATVRFDENLKIAANTNVRAVRDLIAIAKRMKHLQSLVHVSTAYSNCTRKDISETFYEPPITSEQLLNITDSLDEKLVQDITKNILGKWPNTYAFTKALGENCIDIEGNGLPISIVRPSIVLATSDEPVPGWIDNVYGPTGILLGAAIGLIRVLHCKSTNLADMVPADYVVNTCIAAAWKAHEDFTHEKPKKVTIYNCVSSPQKPINWESYMALSYEHGHKIPSPLVLWHYFFFLTNSKFLYDLSNIVLHKFPAHIIDLIAVCIGKKPLLVKGYQKIDKFSMVISYFSTRQWEFHNTNTQRLWKDLSIKDTTLFDFNMAAFSWEKYFPKYMNGCRLYLLKDTPETIEAGRKKMFKLRIAHYALVSILFYTFYKIICFFVALFVL